MPASPFTLPALAAILPLLSACLSPVQMQALSGQLGPGPQPTYSAAASPPASPASCEAEAQAERQRYLALIPTRSTATCRPGLGDPTSCAITTSPNLYAERAYQLALARCQAK